MTKRLLAIYLVLVVLVAGLIPGCTGTAPQKYDLTMAANPAAGGTATDLTGGSPYEKDTEVSIQAVPASCYRFTGWTALAGTFDDATAATTNFTMPAQDVTVTANFAAITLGHFRFYDVSDTAVPPPIGKGVELEDQFGAINATVQEAIVFGNAAEKIHDSVTSPISDPDHHLTLYRLEPETQPQMWYVEVKNQFGEAQQLTVRGPFWLAVPTQKEDHEAPRCLDHFLIYEVLPQEMVDPFGVELNDQWTQGTVEVWEPVFFANPVKKTVGSEVTEIQNPDDHLVFYRIEGEPFERTVQIDNQFGEQTLDLINPALMAVPSEKQSWEEVPPPYDHFMCYDVMPGTPIEESVFLEDQFGSFEAVVLQATTFANPAQKCHGGSCFPPSNPDNHVTVYAIGAAPLGEWAVGVVNQFGRQDLTVSGPVALAVPTMKEGHPDPIGLDHYLLYQVIGGEPLDVWVSLYDQFTGVPEALVLEPVFFGNPVKKTHDTVVTPIENPDTHVVIYKISGGEYAGGVLIYNQFGEQYVNVYGPTHLAAFSGKLYFDPIG